MGGIEENAAMVPSNIAKMAYLLGNGRNQHEMDQKLLKQKVYYHSGVATGVNNKIESDLEGNFGNIHEHLLDAYIWLAKEYKEGDEIYAFGFSRGATIVRSLFSFVRHVGLIRVDSQDRESLLRLAKSALDLYKTRNNDLISSETEEFKNQSCHNTPILKFIGVFDTVEALDVPDGYSSLLPSSYLTKLISFSGAIEENDYHDLRIGNQVQHAYHAISMDENREFFPPTMFEAIDSKFLHPNATREQKWFRGAHADVGGGFWEHGLADIALDWMIENGRRAGLKIREREAFDAAFSPFLLGVDRDFYFTAKERVIHDYFDKYPSGSSPLGNKKPRDLNFYMDSSKFFKSDFHDSVLKEFPAAL
ncbi:UNVERIFIED_CONTAM: hypothetical protein HDU68_008461 [Siphonaria sp. JEL0065]|nr:hypothetical protein HDU68_008461 [Siphonaria sp. JEL0065]